MPKKAGPDPFTSAVAIALILSDDRERVRIWSQHIKTTSTDVTPAIHSFRNGNQVRPRIGALNGKLVLVVASVGVPGILLLVQELRNAGYQGPVITASLFNDLREQLTALGCIVCTLDQIPGHIQEQLPPGIDRIFSLRQAPNSPTQEAIRGFALL